MLESSEEKSSETKPRRLSEKQIIRLVATSGISGDIQCGAFAGFWRDKKLRHCSVVIGKIPAMLSFRQMPRSVLLELLERLVVLLVKTIRFPAVIPI